MGSLSTAHGARTLRPSEALYAAGAVGPALRCRRSDAAEVEPWRLGGPWVGSPWVGSPWVAAHGWQLIGVEDEV